MHIVLKEQHSCNINESDNGICSSLTQTKKRAVYFRDIVPKIREGQDGWIHEPVLSEWNKMTEADQVQWAKCWGFYDIYKAEQESKGAEVVEEEVYYPEWNGYYNKHDIEFLNNYYNRLAQEKDLSDIASQDFARKMALYSLAADERYQAYRKGQATLQDVRDAQALFESVSKTGSLTPKNRIDNNGANSFGELCAYIENKGVIRTTKIDYPKDSIDEMIDTFRHIFTATKGEPS